MQHELGELVLTFALLLIGWTVSFVEALFLVVGVVQAVDLCWSVFNVEIGLLQNVELNRVIFIYFLVLLVELRKVFMYHLEILLPLLVVK